MICWGRDRCRFVDKCTHQKLVSIAREQASFGISLLYSVKSEHALCERISMTYQPLNPGAISISQAKIDDLLPILHLFDEAVVWLNQRSMEKQWGTEPFSASPQIYEQFLG